MYRPSLRIPRPGTVLGVIALSVALGGTAQALPGVNVVDNDDLDSQTVASREIENNSVRSIDIHAGAVKSGELGTIVVRSATTAIPDGGSGRAEAECLAGETPVGGGGMTQQSSSDAIFHGSHPSIGGGVTPVDGNAFTDWNAKATNVAGNLATVDVKAYILCLQ